MGVCNSTQCKRYQIQLSAHTFCLCIYSPLVGRQVSFLSCNETGLKRDYEASTSSKLYCCCWIRSVHWYSLLSVHHAFTCSYYFSTLLLDASHPQDYLQIPQARSTKDAACIAPLGLSELLVWCSAGRRTSRPCQQPHCASLCRQGQLSDGSGGQPCWLTLLIQVNLPVIFDQMCWPTQTCTVFCPLHKLYLFILLSFWMWIGTVR